MKLCSRNVSSYIYLFIFNSIYMQILFHKLPIVHHVVGHLIKNYTYETTCTINYNVKIIIIIINLFSFTNDIILTQYNVHFFTINTIHHHRSYGTMFHVLSWVNIMIKQVRHLVTTRQVDACEHLVHVQLITMVRYGT